MGKQLPSEPKNAKASFIVRSPFNPKLKKGKYLDEKDEEEKKVPSNSAQDHPLESTTPKTNWFSIKPMNLMNSSDEETTKFFRSSKEQSIANSKRNQTPRQLPLHPPFNGRSNVEKKRDVKIIYNLRRKVMEEVFKDIMKGVYNELLISAYWTGLTIDEFNAWLEVWIS